MKTLAILLSAVAVSALLSGCAYDGNGYAYGSGRYDGGNYYNGANGGYYNGANGGYYNDGRHNCRNDYDRRYCR